MQFIQDRIQNNGSIVPEMLQMVEQLRKGKSENENPHAIQAVGAGNYASFITNLTSYFKNLKTKQQKEEDENDEDIKREEEQDEADLAMALQIMNEEDNA